MSAGIVQRHPHFTLLGAWEKTQLLSMLNELDKECELMHAKVSDFDIVLIRFRYQCQLTYKPPRFLSLVEIEREKYYTRLQYFSDIGFTAIRMVIYEPRRLSRHKQLDRVKPVHLEIYLFPQ